MPKTGSALLTGFLYTLSIAYGAPEARPMGGMRNQEERAAVRVLKAAASKPADPLLPIVNQPDIRPHDRLILDKVLKWFPTICRDNIRHLVVRYDPEA